MGCIEMTEWTERYISLEYSTRNSLFVCLGSVDMLYGLVCYTNFALHELVTFTRGKKSATRTQPYSSIDVPAMMTSYFFVIFPFST